MPFGIRTVQSVSVGTPFTLPKLSMDLLSDKLTLIFSNLNASKEVFDYMGKKFLGSFYYGLAVGKISVGITICSVGHTMHLSCVSD